MRLNIDRLTYLNLCKNIFKYVKKIVIYPVVNKQWLNVYHM